MNCNKLRLCVIGNCPSSGSTLLADILDSVPAGICGPELNLFSNFHFYSQPSSEYQLGTFAASASIYKTRIKLNEFCLGDYGLGEEEFQYLYATGADVSGSLLNIFNRLKEFRGKKQANIWFEKTPENVSCIEKFCTQFPMHNFICMVRNPYNNVYSLTKRGFSLELSLESWLIDNAIIMTHAPKLLNAIVLRYEDLIERPFSSISDLLLEKFNESYSATEIEDLYQNNDYRKHTTHLESWTRGYGEVTSANVVVPNYVREYINSNLNLCVSDSYSSYFGFCSYTVGDIMEFHDYPILNEPSPMIGMPDNHTLKTTKLHYMKKWVNTALHSKALGSHCCLTPTRKNK